MKTKTTSRMSIMFGVLVGGVLLMAPMAAGAHAREGLGKRDRLIRQLLTARDDDDREDAAKELGRIGGSRALEALEYAVEHDRDRGVRKKARKAAEKVRARIYAAELIDRRPGKVEVVVRRPPKVKVVVHRPPRVVVRHRPVIRRKTIVHHRLGGRRALTVRHRPMDRHCGSCRNDRVRHSRRRHDHSRRRGHGARWQSGLAVRLNLSF